MNALEFNVLKQAVDTWRYTSGHPAAALATLIATRGSAFRRSGAAMLVFADGRIVRGLSAGCPESDIAARACEAMVDNAARRMRYDREHGYDALMELGCGGELDVLIEPLLAEPIVPALDAIAACLGSRRHGAALVLHAVDGHCLRNPRRLVWSDGVAFDGLGTDAAANAVRGHAGALARAASASNHVIEAGASTVEVFVDPIAPPLQLLLVGRTAVSEALARVGASLGWQVGVVSHTRESAIELPAGIAQHIVAPEQIATHLHLDSRTAVLVATHNLERDLAYLRGLAPVPLLYLGALGSRARARKMYASLGDDATDRLRSPAGLDIGAETPEEIALSVTAEIQAVASRHAGAPLVSSRGPIH